MDIDIFVWVLYGVLFGAGLAILLWQLGHEAWLQMQCWWVRWTFKGSKLEPVPAMEAAEVLDELPVEPEPPTSPKKTLAKIMLARAVGKIPTEPRPKEPWRRASR